MANGGKRPGAGRKPGVPNKATKSIEEKLAKLGCSPIEGMARIAMNPKVDMAIRAKMYAELASYVYAKRRSVELSTEEGRELVVRVERIGEKRGYPPTA